MPARYLSIFLGSLWIWRVLRSEAKCNGLAPQMAYGKFQRLHAFPFGSPNRFGRFPAPWQGRLSYVNGNISQNLYELQLFLGLSQTSGVDGSSGMAVDFTLRCRGAAHDPECNCRAAEAPVQGRL
jgi:hypothetical protein